MSSCRLHALRGCLVFHTPYKAKTKQGAQGCSPVLCTYNHRRTVCKDNITCRNDINCCHSRERRQRRSHQNRRHSHRSYTAYMSGIMRTCTSRLCLLIHGKKEAPLRKNTQSVLLCRQPYYRIRNDIL